jgi:hypothetical protein
MDEEARENIVRRSPKCSIIPLDNVLELIKNRCGIYKHDVA